MLLGSRQHGLLRPWARIFSFPNITITAIWGFRHSWGNDAKVNRGTQGRAWGRRQTHGQAHGVPCSQFLSGERGLPLHRVHRTRLTAVTHGHSVLPNQYSNGSCSQSSRMQPRRHRENRMEVVTIFLFGKERQSTRTLGILHARPVMTSLTCQST